MSSGPCVVLVLEGDNAIKKNRELMGATDPAKAEHGRFGRRMVQISNLTPCTVPMRQRRRSLRSAISFPKWSWSGRRRLSPDFLRDRCPAVSAGRRVPAPPLALTLFTLLIAACTVAPAPPWHNRSAIRPLKLRQPLVSSIDCVFGRTLFCRDPPVRTVSRYLS